MQKHLPKEQLSFAHYECLLPSKNPVVRVKPVELKKLLPKLSYNNKYIEK